MTDKEKSNKEYLMQERDPNSKYFSFTEEEL